MKNKKDIRENAEKITDAVIIDKEFISGKEARRYLKISYNLFYNLKNANGLTPVLFRGFSYYKFSDIERIEEEIYGIFRQNKDLINSQEACEILNVTRSHFEYLLKICDIPTYKVLKKLYMKRGDIVNMVGNYLRSKNWKSEK